MSGRLVDKVREYDDTFPDIPVIVADQVAENIDNLPDDNPPPTREDYGVVIPPFPEVFIEAKTKLPTPDDSDVVIWRGLYLAPLDMEADWAQNIEEYHLPIRHKISGGTRWLVTCYAFSFIESVEVHWYPGMGADPESGYLILPGFIDHGSFLYLELDNEGMILSDPQWVQGTLRDEMVDDPRGKEYFRQAVSFVPMALHTLSAMHRRAPVTKVTPRTSRQYRRLLERQNKPIPTEYYVLQVEANPSPRKVYDVTTPSSVSGGVREHDVRGHIRWVGPKGVAGRGGAANKPIWIPPHTRGDSGLGRIKKDYEVINSKEA